MTKIQAETLVELRRSAAAQVAQYPQYDGVFEKYVLVSIRRQVNIRGRMYFAAGELAIAQPATRLIESGPYAGKPAVTVWSNFRGIDTSVRANFVEYR